MFIWCSSPLTSVHLRQTPAPWDLVSLEAWNIVKPQSRVELDFCFVCLFECEVVLFSFFRSWFWTVSLWDVKRMMTHTSSGWQREYVWLKQASAKPHRQPCIHADKEQVSTCTHTEEIPQNKNAHTHTQKFHKDTGCHYMTVSSHSHLFISLSPSFPRRDLHFHTPLSPLPFHPPSALIHFSQHRSHSLTVSFTHSLQRSPCSHV